MPPEPGQLQNAMQRNSICPIVEGEYMEQVERTVRKRAW